MRLRDPENKQELAAAAASSSPKPIYADYFGLSEAPFSIAPDPHYLYMTSQHQEALAHMLYGVQSEGGFVLLTGEVGTGKTTVCRCFLEQLPEHCDVAFIVNPKLNAHELLSTICEELCVLPVTRTDVTIKTLVDRINSQLLHSHSKGRHTILIIDEAQNLSLEVLEQMRLLTNLETNKRKLLQIIMIGQPELRDMLGKPNLKQLSQRITARYHLGPLSRPEVAFYIRHRLAVAGYQGHLFAESAIRRLYKLSKGIPRVINLLCDRALLGAYVEGKGVIDKKVIARAAHEVFGDEHHKIDQTLNRRGWLLAGSLTCLLLIALVTAAYMGSYRPPEQAMQKAPSPENSSLTARRVVPLSDAEPQISTARDQQDRAAEEPVRQEPKPETEPEPDHAVLASAPLEAAIPAGESKSLGFSALFRQWEISFDPNSALEPCVQAAVEGLQCLSLEAGWDELLKVDRPCLMELVGQDQVPFYLTLVSFDGDYVRAEKDGSSNRYLVQDVISRWTGRITLLWRPPPGYVREIRIGDEGPIVAWLVSRLAIVTENPPRLGGGTVFGDKLLKAVQDFQQSCGLKPDGIVGPQTLIQLNTRLKSEGPRLTTARSGAQENVLHTESAKKG